MSVIQLCRSRGVLALNVILSPPRGYVSDSWKDSSSAQRISIKRGETNGLMLMMRTSMPRVLVYADLRQWYRLKSGGHAHRHYQIHERRTMRYSIFACSSVKSRISLHKNARNLRPLFALFRMPSLSSVRAPMCRVGAVRSSRLRNAGAMRGLQPRAVGCARTLGPARGSAKGL